MVTSDVLISPPDVREGETDIYKENAEAVNRFWTAMMGKYGTEREYNKQIINAFKNAETPEIIIVVDKLITGFDAPRNTVLYLTRTLKDHTLLQAIARVNRLHEGKEFGYIIDYRGILENLDHAMDLYGSLESFDADDLNGTLQDISSEIKKLPQRYSELWDVFNEVKDKGDEEKFERLLADEALRVMFYERFSAFARTFAIALSSENFLQETPQNKIAKYRTDLKFFKDLRGSVQRRYAEIIDFSEYESKIQKLIDTHVGTGEVERITELINIFDKDKFAEEIEKQVGDARRADTIAHRTKRTIEERMQEDPAFYMRFSVLLEEAIRAFKDERIQAAEYLKRVKDVMNSVVNKTGYETPESIKYNDAAKAYYGVVFEILDLHKTGNEEFKEIAATTALAIDKIIMSLRIVNWTMNTDCQNQMRNRIEDCLFELKGTKGIELTFDEIDSIMDQCIDIAKVRVL